VKLPAVDVSSALILLALIVGMILGATITKWLAR
jgi:hypothetical protein